MVWYQDKVAYSWGKGGPAEPLSRLARIARCVGGKNAGYHSNRADSMSTVQA